MQKTNRGLVYFISETHHFEQKRSVAVMGLVGSFVGRNEHSILECIDAVSKLSCKSVVLNFRDVFPEIDPTTASWVRRLIDAAREKAISLRISAVHPVLRAHLQEEGSVGEEEMVNNLAQALEMVAELERAAA